MWKALTILIVGTLLCSSLFTPLVYSGLGSVFGEVPWPFSRVYDRVAMLFVLVFLIIYRRSFSLGNLREFFRAGSRQSKWSGIIVGVVLTLGSVLIALPLVVSEGNILWRNPDFQYLTWKLAKLLPAAFLISFIEESFFRVLLYWRLRKGMTPVFAALVCSVLYALAHFITPDKSFVYEGYSLLVGFEYLGAVFQRIILPGTWTAFLGLLFVGFVLSVVMERSRSVYLCIGLHAGWVMGVKLCGYLTEAAPHFAFPPGPGRRYYLVSQPIGWISVLLVGVFVLVVLRRFKIGIQKHELKCAT